MRYVQTNMGRGIQPVSASSALRGAQIDLLRAEPEQIVIWVVRQTDPKIKDAAESKALEEFAQSVYHPKTWTTPPAIVDYENQMLRPAVRPIRQLVAAGRSEQARDVLERLLEHLDMPYSNVVASWETEQIEQCLQVPEQTASRVRQMLNMQLLGA